MPGQGKHRQGAVAGRWQYRSRHVAADGGTHVRSRGCSSLRVQATPAGCSTPSPPSAPAPPCSPVSAQGPRRGL